jgi:tetratricopeptide (TPR) repeat protein
MVAAALTACDVRSDHERLGDRRYAEGAWVDALAEYRLATHQRRPSLELRAKLGAAALRAGALSEAVAAWKELAAADPSSAGEAVDGLVRTARAAAAARDVQALRLAAEALLALAPRRRGDALGPSLVAALEAEGVVLPTDLLLVAAAQAPAIADSLVAVWAENAAREGRCPEAGAAWAGLIRRGGGPVLERRARAGMASCRLDEGRALLADGKLEEAELALSEATLTGAPDSLARLAWVLIGDARWAAGDSALAAEAYRKAIEGGAEDDPSVLRAQEQLQRLLGNQQEP